MKISEEIKTKKISRKKFIFYSGLASIGVYSLIKIPFGFFKKREKAEAENNQTGEIKFNMNPESVKRA